MCAETATVAKLQATVARLKASRDKLLAEVDAQSAEIERLSHEATALAAVCLLCTCLSNCTSDCMIPVESSGTDFTHWSALSYRMCCLVVGRRTLRDLPLTYQASCVTPAAN